MRIVLYIMLFVSGTLYSQTLTQTQVSRYVKTIDSLRHHKSLQKINYSQMSLCGGALTGYYYKTKLVYVHSVHSGELGFNEQELYLKDSIPYKLNYREHFAEWDTYYTKYPSEKFEFDEKKMSYSDTLYHITFTNPLKVAKTSKGKYINTTINPALLEQRRSCIKIMLEELEHEKPR